MLTAVRGLVIRTVNVGEKDKILTLFTEENGLMSVYASGSRVVKSKLLAAADLFCFADYVLYGKGERYSVREAELIESFYGLRTDLVKTALGNYVIDIARAVGTENQADVPFLRLVLNTLYAISLGKHSLWHIKAAFEARAAAVLGFCPDLSACGICGEEIGGEELLLEVMDGNLICAKCKKEMQNSFMPVEEEGHRSVLCILTPGVLAAWHYVTECSLEKILSFRLENPTDKRLWIRSTEEFLLNHLDRGFISLDFYKQVADKEPQ